jgi:DNA-binding CsgD family transcriptional regulator
MNKNILETFSHRELDILSCAVNRYSNKETASLLNISHRTVETHIHNIFIKTGCLTKEEVACLLKKAGAWNELCTRHEKLSETVVSPPKHENRSEYAYGIALISVAILVFLTLIFQTEKYCLKRKNVENQIESTVNHPCLKRQELLGQRRLVQTVLSSYPRCSCG